MAISDIAAESDFSMVDAFAGNGWTFRSDLMVLAFG